MFDYDIVSLDQDHEVYAGVDTADAYLNAAIHGQSWFALEDNVKGQALVTATRTLDRQVWKGEVAESSPLQALDWPRINTGVPGVVDNEIPEDIIAAAIELALSLSQGSGVQTEGNTSQKIQSLKAGSVAITYFGGVAVTSTTRFPQIIDELVQPYLLAGGAAGVNTVSAGGVAFGTDGESMTHQDFGLIDGM
jgi:hypothetical protein